MIPTRRAQRAACLCLLLWAAACAPRGPAPAGEPYPRGARLPDDSSVIRGRLWNGLSYYVRANHEPRRRAELRLVVNAGSILEDEDQRGLAHVVEHMAFNGTTHFAKNELVDYLEGVGMRFGPDINAYTSYDETVYMLTLPTDSAGVLDTGMQILQDWATGITFDTAEVRKERGVVVEEWRLGRGAAARVQERQMPVLFRRSRYASRSPIGDPEVVRRAPVAAIERFYRTWYRPELMAVVAVGDFDPKAMEAKIRTSFAWIAPSAKPRPRERFSVPGHEGTRYAVASDAELTSAMVTLVHTTPSHVRRTAGEYRRAIVESLYSGMLNERLNELTQRPGAPFLGVSSFSGSLVRPVNAAMLTAEASENGVERALASLLTEAQRVARHGFTEGELAREKANQLRSWEQIFAERDKATSGQFAGGYASHYLYGGPLLDLATEYRLQQAYLPGVSLDEVNARARELLGTRDRTVMASVPAKPGVRVPDEARLAAVVDSVRRADVQPYRETDSGAALMATLPAPGRVVSETRIPEAGVTRWTLSNGARVVLRPTDFRADEILFIGRAPGGTSLVPDSLWLDAQTATAAVQVGGVGTLSVVDLQKRLSGKAASVGTDIDELAQGVSGYAAPRDVETMFQLVHLYFTQPRRDSSAWEAYRERARESFRNRGASPEGAFVDSIQKVLSRDDPRGRPLTPASFDSLRLDRALEVYRRRFADAGGFTFYLVGNFSPDSVRPLVERYLASLPATGAHETWRDRGVRPPTGVVRRTVRRGLEPKARTELVFTGGMEFSRASGVALRALSDVLEIRLRERLREDLGGTYGVGVGASSQRDPAPMYRVSIDFGADPGRLDELTRVVFQQIELLKRDGPTPQELDKVREEMRREKEISLRDNGWWTMQLVSYDRLGWDLRSITDAADAPAPVTAELVRQAARRYLDPQSYVQVSLLPER
ncbi:MAG: peptidase domain protein [Gemmatimonadetes bacterium]|nr:peptidase domain protein [Gemmatimonadota bacterium]